jgi:ubiquinone/menaquinone biosynthesis C-methylase UbiE
MTQREPGELDRYKVSSLRAYNEKLPDRYDTSMAVRLLRVSSMDDFVLGVLGSQVMDSSILDVGCATGRLLERLAEAGARRLAGSDLAPRILEVAQRKLARFELEPDLRSADAETSLPWESHTFDVVTLTGVLHHFCRPNLALREIARVLRRGGTLVVADACFFPPVREVFNLCLRVHPHEGDCRFYTVRGTCEILESSGWEVSRCERLNWWAFGAVGRSFSSGAALAN